MGGYGGACVCEGVAGVCFVTAGVGDGFLQLQQLEAGAQEFVVELKEVGVLLQQDGAEVFGEVVEVGCFAVGGAERAPMGCCPGLLVVDLYVLIGTVCCRLAYGYGELIDFLGGEDVAPVAVGLLLVGLVGL